MNSKMCQRHDSLNSEEPEATNKGEVVERDLNESIKMGGAAFCKRQNVALSL